MTEVPKPIQEVESTLGSASAELSQNLSGKIHTTLQSHKTEDVIMEGSLSKWTNYLTSRLEQEDLSGKERGYYSRILRILGMPELSEQVGHPINMIVQRIIGSEFYRGYRHVKSPEVVREWETFDLFNFPEDHVARRPSDSYFLCKSDNKKDSMLLRPHTSVMWYYYLLEQGGKEELMKTGETKALSWGKVYRVDELDKTHHECFSQIDGLRITAKEKEVINQETLKDVISNTLKAIFGDTIEYRFNEDNFPYTTNSLEAEVKYNGKWMEVLGGGIVHPTVLEKLGIDSDKYNGWAYGFGLDRLAMTLKGIPDIRIFWSNDARITKQWGNFEPYREVSLYPPVYKDISMLVQKDKFQKLPIGDAPDEVELTKDTESDFFAMTGLMRDIGGDLIEEVKITEIFENDEKFGKDYKSLTLRIVFRSIERTLRNEEVNTMYHAIRKGIEQDLGYNLR